MKSTIKLAVINLFAVGILISFNSCGIYSFTGASISPTIKTISIENFFNDSPDGPPNLSQQFTETIRDYFQSNTSLELVQADGDLQFEGSIVSYVTSPVGAVSGGAEDQFDQAGQTRLTITVKVAYLNTQDDEFDFDRSFSFYEDFNSQTTNLTSVEPQLIEVIFDQIVLDVFSASVANW